VKKMEEEQSYSYLAKPVPGGNYTGRIVIVASPEDGGEADAGFQGKAPDTGEANDGD
jgi:hypothetical protein